MQLNANTIIDRTGNILFRVSLTEDDGRVISKTLMPESFLELIHNSCTLENRFVHLGKLPDGYMDASVSSNDTFRILIKVPARKRLLVHTSGHYYIPFPDLVFYFEVSNGILKQKYVYSLKGEENLCHYPFGNVSPNGSICMGNISCKDLTMEKIEKIIDSFFSGMTNNDYYKANQNVTVNYSQQVLLEKLSNMDEFPLRWLSKSPIELNSLKENLRKDK